MRMIWNPLRLIGPLLFALALPLSVAGADAAKATSAKAEWSENFEQAQAKAKSAGRPMLLLFTGSDWCPPCMQLERRVFSSDAFARFAENEVVLMKADFPRRKQDEKIARQNAALQERYPIQGYPTVFILDPESGKVLHSTMGYANQTPAEYVEAIRAALKQG